MATKQMVINQSVSKDGRQYPAIQKKIPAESMIDIVVEPTAAKTGQLTTRTSDTVGTLTMTAGHGIVDANRIDLFWSGGARIGVIVGVVSVNSVPITGGTGDNLPANLTQITAKVAEAFGPAFVGTDAQGLFLVAPANADAVFAFTQADNTLIFAKRVAAGDMYAWDVQSGVTNPITGQTVGKIYISHAASDAVREVTAVTYIN